MVDRDGLENRLSRKGYGGSNPPLSAITFGNGPEPTEGLKQKNVNHPAKVYYFTILVTDLNPHRGGVHLRPEITGEGKIRPYAISL